MLFWEGLKEPNVTTWQRWLLPKRCRWRATIVCGGEQGAGPGTLPGIVKNGCSTVCLLAKCYCTIKLGVLRTQMGRWGMLYNQYNEAFRFQFSISVSQIFLNDHNIERAKGWGQIRANSWPLQAGMLPAHPVSLCQLGKGAFPYSTWLSEHTEGWISLILLTGPHYTRYKR